MAWNAKTARARLAAPLAETDAEAAAAIKGETTRQRQGLELIASENLVSRAVLEAQGSVFTNKTVEGLPDARYYGGAQYADEIENLAIARACELFGARFANVQSHSGSNANHAVYLACMKEGDALLSMDLAAGGHVSHGHPATQTGRRYNVVSYGVAKSSERIDYRAVARIAREHRPKLIIAGGSAYPREIDFASLRAIADKVGARLLVDMAHIAGLIAAGLHPHPFPHAHIVTTTTYKSLGGARGGLILWNDEALSRRLNGAVFPGVQGSVMLHGVAGKAVALGEALQGDFRGYQRAAKRNADALAETLMAGGARLVAGGTDTTLMLVDVGAAGLTGAAVSESLERAHIAVNKNVIPRDPLPAELGSGIRLSTNAGTMRGFGVREFRAVGGFILEILAALKAHPDGDPAVEAKIAAKVLALAARFPIYDHLTAS